MDDEPGILKLLRQHLDGRGFDIIEACDGATALRLCRESPPDLVVTDIVMPVKEGGQLICSVCKQIRDDKGYWNQIEAYIEAHSDAEFSHSICQKCAEAHYPGMGIYDD